jgi:hypothetical protein
MEDKKTDNQIKSLLESAQSIIIILPPDPGKDLVAAGVSLHLALKSSGKISQIGCGSDVHVNEPLEGVSEIADSIGSRNLIISFDYREDDLDKVDYDVRDDGKFYLMVKPKAGSPVPDIGGVKYSYSGAEADLVITLGVNSLEELGKIYADEKKFLDNVNIVSLQNSLRPAAFTSHLYHKNLGSFSELVTVLLEEMKLKITPPIAENLLNSIYESTNNLTGSRLTADTFAAVAFLMRAGAHLPGRQTATPRFSQAPFFEVPFAPARLDEGLPADEEGIPLPEEESLSAGQAGLSADEADTPVPSDWQKPKIFRVGDNKSN